MPYAAGDRLWVREALGRRTASFFGIEATNGTQEAFYRADDEDVVNEHGFNLCPWWKGDNLSPIHMPRPASRLTLLVDEVRVQRLQEISEEDAEAEGCARNVFGTYEVRDLCVGQTASRCFRQLWESINGPDAWSANPWVAAITFDVIRANIDALPPAIGSARVPTPDPGEVLHGG